MRRCSLALRTRRRSLDRWLSCGALTAAGIAQIRPPRARTAADRLQRDTRLLPATCPCGRWALCCSPRSWAAFMAMIGRSSPSISPNDAAMLGPSDADLQVSAQMAVQAQLRDPGSAQFRDVVVVRQDSSTAVCGEVNAKNGFGGYIGYSSFVAIGSLVQLQTKRDDGFHTLWNAACVRTNVKGEAAGP